MRDAVPAIAGVVSGGLVLLAVVATGAGGLLATHATWRATIAALGAGYMGWLGIRLLCSARGAGLMAVDALPAGALGMFGFQFLNPKGWAMVLAIVAARPASGPRDYLPLVLLFTAIPLACLLLWSLAGRLLAARLADPRSRHRLDVAMGGLLVASAALLLLDL
jgi:threonine/homoserine/homoserine lactone efflux protein